jgi:poly-gamma-glutamate synthesis protein (capsule biosynthesis protein)
MYFADLNPATGKLMGLRMIPTQVRRFRVNRAASSDARWLEALLNREGKPFGTAVKRDANNILMLHWN